MAIPKNKQELIDDIKATYEKLRPEFADISAEQAREKTIDGQVKNTKMSAHNLLAYLVGWGEMMLDWDKSYLENGEVPDFQTSDYGSLAQKFYAQYENYSYEDLLKKFDETVAKIIKMLESKTNAELYEQVWYTTKSSAKDYTFGRLVQINTSSPYKNSRGRLRKWKKEAQNGNE